MTEIMLTKSGFVVIGGTGGHTVIAKESPLKRLNYFDGKFLRAPDLKLEQLALMNQVRMSNQAGGSGVVYGYNCTLVSGDRFRVGRGLAIDSLGRVLYLPDEIHVGIAELIEKSRIRAAAVQAQQPFVKFAPAFSDCELLAAEEPGDVLEEKTLYLITVGYAEAYCGEEDVYGKLCEEACISSTERPYIIEGVVIRAVPLNLSVLMALSNKIALSNIHLRSRVASAYFEQERQSPATLISRDGLSSNVWCLGAEAEDGADVPIAVLARSGSTTLFLDAWIARRERMETPPRHYWAGRMAMRPWNVFLAQVLQFQCQLTQCFKDGVGEPIGPDPCEDERTLAAKASEAMKVLLNQYETISAHFAEPAAISVPPAVFEIADFRMLQQNLADIAKIAITNRYLINCGIIELPSAGYLPVSPSEALTVNEQVRRMMGEGVDLRFCVVRPDYVAHALEEAQHMERISLLEGIDAPDKKPKVDVLVPDGRIEEFKEEAPGTGYEMELTIPGIGLVDSLVPAPAVMTYFVTYDSPPTTTSYYTNPLYAPSYGYGYQSPSQGTLRGAGRGEQLETGGYAFYYAAQTPEVTSSAQRQQPSQALWVGLRTDRDPFALKRGESTQVTARSVYVTSLVDANSMVTLNAWDVSSTGELRINDIQQRGSEMSLTCQLNAHGSVSKFVEQAGTRTHNTSLLTLNETVHVVRDQSGGPRPTVRVRVPNPSLWSHLGNITFQFERVWNDTTTAEVSAQYIPVAVLFVPQPQPIFQGTQKINNEVLKPGHVLHSASLSALARVGAALNNKDFADFAATQLFPPPAPVPDELKVYARHDWVLFHRRRDIVCGFERLPIAVVQPRRFRVFRAIIEGNENIADLRTGLLENRSEIISRYNPQPVTVVEFAAGIPSVRTSYEDIRADWQRIVNNDVDIALGVVACRDAAFDEGQTLAVARLNNLVDVLGPVAELAENAELLWASQVPDVLAHGEVDGIIVFATQAVETVCHRVYRVEVPQDGLQALTASLTGTNNYEDVLVTQYGARELLVDDRPRFRIGKSNLYLAETAKPRLTTAWVGAGGGLPYATRTLVQSAAGSIPEDQPYSDQAATIAATLNPNPPQSQELVGISQALTECPAVTILIAVPQAQNYVYLYKAADPTAIEDKWQGDIGLTDDFPLITNTPWQGSRWTPLGTVWFDTNNTAVQASLSNVASQATANIPVDPLTGLYYVTSVIALSRRGATSEQQDLDKQQAEQIQEALGLTVDITPVVHGNDTWPIVGTAMTVIVTPAPNVIPVLVNEPTTNTNVTITNLDVTAASPYAVVTPALPTNTPTVTSITWVTTAETDPTVANNQAEALLQKLRTDGVAAPNATYVVNVIDPANLPPVDDPSTNLANGYVVLNRAPV